jgi:hypothetical protein
VTDHERQRDTTWLQWKSAILNRQVAVVQLVTTFITCALTFIGTAAGFGELGSIFSSPKATIMSPSEPSVPKEFRLTGTVENFKDDDVLWAVSRRWDTGKFYPQDKPCSVFTDGKFDCGDYFLGNQYGADTGKSFDLMIIHANIEAVKTFLLYQREDIARGLDDLPKGATVLDRAEKRGSDL